MNELIFIQICLLTLGYGVSAAGYHMCGTTSKLAQFSDRYTVYFQTCSAPDPITECCSPDFQNISSAWLVNDSSHPNGTALNHNSSHFWIKSSQLSVRAGGGHVFHFEYFYSCYTTPRQCHQDNITLALQVAKFHLRALNSTVEKLDFAVQSDVRLLCHSDLNDSKNIKTIFNFKSRDGSSYSATCYRNQNKTIHHDGSHWWIYRMKGGPHDCVLRIQNINRSDVGEYQCVGHLPIGGKFEHAWSNFENLTVYQNESSSRPHAAGINTGIAVAAGFVVILLLVVTVRVCVMIRKHRRPPDPEPHPADPPPPPPTLPPHSRGDHSANTQAAVLAVDPHRGGTPPIGGRGTPSISGRGTPPIGGRGTPPIGGHGTPPIGGHGTPPIGGRGTTDASGHGRETVFDPDENTPLLHSFSHSEGSSGDRERVKQKLSAEECSRTRSRSLGTSQDPALQSFNFGSESGSRKSNSSPGSAENGSQSCDYGSFDSQAAADYVRRQNQPPKHTPDSDALIDENLKCPKCGHMYREGQIQNFRKHVAACQSEATLDSTTT